MDTENQCPRPQDLPQGSTTEMTGQSPMQGVVEEGGQVRTLSLEGQVGCGTAIWLVLETA